MSSKNRGKPSIEGDRYYTPPWVTRQFTDIVLPDICGSTLPRHILEPSAGGGAFVGPLRKATSHVIWDDDLSKDGRTIIHAVDLDPLAGPWPDADESYVKTDFLSYHSDVDYDLTAGNPPFEPAIRFVQHALELSEIVSFLLRIGFIASKERRQWLRANPPRHLHMLAHRPAFLRKGGSDSCDYAFLTWERWHTSTTTTHLLPLVSKAERSISAHGVFSYEDGVERSLYHPKLF